MTFLFRSGQRDVSDPGSQEPDECCRAHSEGQLRGQQDVPPGGGLHLLQLLHQRLSAIPGSRMEDEDSRETSPGEFN